VYSFLLLWSEAKKSVEAATSDELHIAMFPWLAFGHISSFIQLSNLLSLLPSCQHLIIPVAIPSIEGLPPGQDKTLKMTQVMAEALKKALELMQPQVKTLLSQLEPHFVVFDFVQCWVPKIAPELRIKSLHFLVYSAVSGAYTMVPVRTSGNKNSTVEDLMKPPEEVEKQSPCDAMEMERPYVDYLKAQFEKPILLGGSLVPNCEPWPSAGVLDERRSKWLEQFPSKSVIYCSSRSENFLSDDQIQELTLGLELSSLLFFLVLMLIIKGSYFRGFWRESRIEELCIPDGFNNSLSWHMIAWAATCATRILTLNRGIPKNCKVGTDKGVLKRV
ncbi:hypothetical protein Tsubulata_027367, partial [Turnera subulata]